jgi:RNA polymerase sigma-70 factor (ECF subfamily)
MIAGEVSIEADAVGTIERAVAGDELAFAEIVSVHSERMARVAYLVSGSLDTAEEAVQAAWAIAWRRLPTLRDPTRLRPWLMSVAANEARQIARGNRRRTVRELRVHTPESGAMDAERAALVDLANALARLGHRDRTLIALRYVAGLESAAIGRELGMSASGVRVRLHRLLGRLREELGDD